MEVQSFLKAAGKVARLIAKSRLCSRHQSQHTQQIEMYVAVQSAKQDQDVETGITAHVEIQRPEFDESLTQQEDIPSQIRNLCAFKASLAKVSD